MFDLEWYKKRNDKLREEQARKVRVQKQANNSSTVYDSDTDFYSPPDSESSSTGGSSSDSCEYTTDSTWDTQPCASCGSDDRDTLPRIGRRNIFGRWEFKE